MNQLASDLTPRKPDAQLDQIVKLVIMAVGGQGGGVLTNWITDLAERNGYVSQATSVAGVSQRTGATVYYVEMLPDSNAQPVFSLMPAEGDVDILIAAEMMEAGRAILRGFVTPDRTTLIASTHRNLASFEKVVPGDGTGDSAKVREAAEISARDLIAFDMDAMAQGVGSVVSASLFGALAGSGQLPFKVESYRDTIRASGRGVETSLAAFELAHDAAKARRNDFTAPVAPKPRVSIAGFAQLRHGWEALETRVSTLPEPVRGMAAAGLRKVVDYQDIAYGAEYLDRIGAIAAQDDATHDFAFTATAAKYLAGAMAYDDILRVADLKTRASRFTRIEAEMGKTADHLLQITEYVHPGAAEFVSLMPARIGAWVEARPGLMRRIDWMVNRGRRMRSDRIWSFSALYILGGLRRWRRSLLRHRAEVAHLENWLETATGRLATDYDLAVETLKVRRLVKGYSDTHARGLAKFDRVMAGAALVEGREDAADWVARLIEAALKDADGAELDGALDTIRSFV